MALRTLISAVALLMSAQAAAAGWPERPITLLVPFSAGGPTDFIARLVAEPLARELGQPVIVQNKAGASGNVGYQSVLNGPHDGYTLLHNTVGMQAINPLMYPETNMKPAQDYVTVGITGAMPNVLVINPQKNDFANLQALVERGRSAPQTLSYANFGPGSSPHVYGALLQKLAGFEAVGVPYKGSANAVTDVLGGQVDFLFDSMTTSLGQIQTGRLKALAITSAQRSPLLPDVPTLKEAGYPGGDLKFWFSLQAPAGTPPEAQQKLRAAIARVVASDAYRAAMQERGAEALSVAPDALDAFMTRETGAWTDAARSIGLKADH
ncbi:Bug family tripartite tricarboxylate transporter substrate binding protein [Bordetella genomosp. 12]|uniref:ABC transporter substrate-binding protein n=1 Tax=Bordetella genomosp. 12 TaxID=463035 RepID=A0A261VVZ9_9BORD|nr:tripartite tricarboxylate transporter substrate binding protein [Bordetella genomosp. 12]OZI77987.1 ABC transporter substrate-binding protein [Bordetella genomosp. 12]